ncbi:phosphatase PAP2 family protein [Clostridium tertium]|uniref:phosphatase PAP2 family protein n=1 Tax=Clostridium tertium TaxID=1559 RepID=UPI001AE54A7E|nr:phosphatase PAP2 family protein [Clostridium tertium]MBP1869495.1 membrane-associated phospholipid phosphatase [Clostridium tertium]
MRDLLKKFIVKYKLNELKWLDLIWLAIFPLININYVILGAIAEKGKNLGLFLDKEIPFVSMFIFPYIYWYIYIFIGLIFILLKDRRKYIRALLAVYIGMFICYFIYYLFPVEIVRPTVVNNNLPNKLVNIIYQNDRPFNCFPSIHVLNTYIIMRYTNRKENKSWFYYTQIVGILIILSTLFIKQHFILDGIAAMVLGEIVISISKKIEDKRIDNILLLPYKLIDKIKEKNDISIS